MGNNKQPTLASGKICYIEIPAIDISASADFYSQVFGWQIRKRSDGHIAFDDTVNEVSGTWVVGRNAQKETGLLVYIIVDDINSAVELIKTHGGKIVQPAGIDAPEITARFSDPAGNIFGIFQE